MDLPRDEEYETILEAEQNSRNGFPIAKELLVMAVMLGLIFGAALVPRLFNHTPQAPANQLANLNYTETVPSVIASTTQFPEITVRARAALVYDLETETTLFSKAAEEPLPLASLTKLMTALLAYEIIESGSPITLEKSAIIQEGDHDCVF